MQPRNEVIQIIGIVARRVCRKKGTIARVGLACGTGTTGQYGERCSQELHFLDLQYLRGCKHWSSSHAVLIPSLNIWASEKKDIYWSHGKFTVGQNLNAECDEAYRIAY